MIHFIKSLLNLIDQCDAKIVSDEGHEVLADPEAMKKVNQAISENKRGPIIVKLKKQRNKDIRKTQN